MEMHDCARYQDRLATLLVAEHGALAEAVAEGRRCGACAALLDDVAAAFAPVPTPDVSAAVARDAVATSGRWARRVYTIGKAINVAASVAIVGLWLAYVELDAGIGWPVTAPSARALAVLAAVLPLGYLALHGRMRDGRRAVLYARWERRQLQGICTGLAEYFALPLWLVRGAFVALFLSGLGGGTIYVLLAFLVNFHPDDRRHLYAFKLQRWWRRRRVAAST